MKYFTEGSFNHIIIDTSNNNMNKLKLSRNNNLASKDRHNLNVLFPHRLSIEIGAISVHKQRHPIQPESISWMDTAQSGEDAKVRYVLWIWWSCSHIPLCIAMKNAETFEWIEVANHGAWRDDLSQEMDHLFYRWISRDVMGIQTQSKNELIK